MVVERSLMTTWSEGPAVSLSGSPTVSPVIDALCASEFLPPKLPSSMNFFALSHAPMQAHESFQLASELTWILCFRS